MTFFRQTGYEGWLTFYPEEELLAVRQACHEEMEQALTRLYAIVAQASLGEEECQQLLYQMSHIQQHLREAINLLAADYLLRTN